MRSWRSGGALLPVIIIGASVANVACPMAQAQPSPVQSPEQPRIEPQPGPELIEARSATWPLALGVHALIGFEPHDRGMPVAFGAGMELLWRARLGGFAELLASEGTPVIPPATSATATQPGFGDRVSVPFGFAARPLAPIGLKRHGWWSRLLTGIGVRVGLTVEHLRTSDDDKTTAGLHLGLGVDVPLWGGTREGGVSLRLYGRLMVTPEITLDCTPTCKVFEPMTSGQLFAGITYYP